MLLSLDSSTVRCDFISSKLVVRLLAFEASKFLLKLLHSSASFGMILGSLISCFSLLESCSKLSVTVFAYFFSSCSC